MNKKDVIISIRGRHFFGEYDDNGPIELVTSGELISSDKEYILVYRESDLTGFDGAVATLMINPERVTFLRSGTVSTQMVFEEGRKHLSYYDTEDGSLLIGVQANKVRTTMNDFGGNIEMEYYVEIDHALSGANHVSINVKETGNWLAFDTKPMGTSYRKLICSGAQ